MNSVEKVMLQIEVSHDLISSIVFGGLLQSAIFLIVSGLKWRQYTYSHKLLGLFVLCSFLIGCDLWLCYTGLIKYVIHLNDSTEFLVLLLGPSLYFFILSLFSKEQISMAQWRLHLILPILYVISQMPYFLSPATVKFNAYLDAYHRAEGFIPFERGTLLIWCQRLKDYWRFILLSSLLFYIGLSSATIYQKRDQLRQFFFSRESNKYDFSKNMLWMLILAFATILIVYLIHDDDLGDHYIALFFSLTSCSFSFFLIFDSKLLTKSWTLDKYDTSGFKKTSDESFLRVQDYVLREQYFLHTTAALQDLADKLDMPSTYLSQIINSHSSSFRDFINQLRVERAKVVLVDPAFQNLTAEAIGASVGFKSKSAFYAAFKKFTDTTPVAFQKQSKP